MTPPSPKNPQERRELELLANQWGLPYTPDTSDQELQDQVSEKIDRPGGTQESQPIPACYGLLWEGVADSLCMDCVYVRGGCLQTFVTKRLPILRAELGPDHTLDQIAALAGVPQNRALRPEAVLIAIKVEADLVSARESPPTIDHTPILDSFTESPASLVGLPGQSGEEEAVVPAKKSAPPGGAKPAGQAKKKTTKKVTKKKVTKKVAKKSTRKKVQNPPEAGAVKRAKAPAPKKTKKAEKAKSARRVSARASVVEYSEAFPEDPEVLEIWTARWERERSRHPLFAAAFPGTLLTRRFKGEDYRVEVHQGGYLWTDTGQWAPTLGMITTLITGTKGYDRQAKMKGKDHTRPKGTRQLSNWSAKKFWKQAFENL